MSQRQNPNFRCGCPKLDNTIQVGGVDRCRRCYRDYQNRYAREHYRPVPRFELVEVKPISESLAGRSYQLAPRRSA